jgi:hypothetical protein
MRWVVSFTLLPFCPTRNKPVVPIGHRAGLTTEEKRENSCACQESNPDSLVVHPVAYFLHRLSCSRLSEGVNWCWSSPAESGAHDHSCGLKWAFSSTRERVWQMLRTTAEFCPCPKKIFGSLCYVRGYVIFIFEGKDSCVCWYNLGVSSPRAPWSITTWKN